MFTFLFLILQNEHLIKERFMLAAYIALGLIAGISSGFLGIGGGTILIPVLVYAFGLTQHQAQGTTLALMVPPIGLLAAIKYYAEGNVKIYTAAFICLGFFIGGLVGAHFAHKVPDLVLKRVFGFFLMAVSIKMILGK
ncbi:MAG: sulfite exporter TauE/SafE family protein [Candidatus Omnitrophota bacterium]